MPDDLFAEKEKNAKSKRTPRRWSVLVIEILLVIAAVVLVYRLVRSEQPLLPPSLDAAQQFEWGSIHYQNGDYEKAREAYTAAIEQGYTPLAMAYFERGRTNASLEEYQAAVDDYTRSIALDIDCDECHVDYHNRGASYWGLEDYDAATRDFQQAIEIAPSYLASHIALADLSLFRGDRAQALTYVQTGLREAARNTIERGLAAGQQRSVAIDEERQQYRFSFSAREGDEITFEITRATLDVVMLLEDSAGTPLAYDDSEASQGGDDIFYVIETAGDYSVTIASYNGSTTGEFTLAMTTSNPDDDSALVNMPRISSENAARLKLVDTIKTQSSLQLAFAPNGVFFAEKAADQLIVYDLEKETIGMRSLAVMPDASWALAISPDGELAAVGTQRTILLYNTRSGSVRQTIRLSEDYPSALAFSPDSALLAIATYNEIRLYDALGGGVLYSLPMEAAYGEALAFSRDGQWLAVGLDKGQVQIWNVAEEALIHTLETGKVEEISAVAFDPNATRIAAGGEARRVYVWDTVSGEQQHMYTLHERKITAVAFSANGAVLASGSADGRVMIWLPNAADTTPAATLTHKGSVSALEFQADGRTLLTTSDDYQLRFWRVKPDTQNDSGG